MRKNLLIKVVLKIILQNYLPPLTVSIKVLVKFEVREYMTSAGIIRRHLHNGLYTCLVYAYFHGLISLLIVYLATISMLDKFSISIRTELA